MKLHIKGDEYHVDMQVVKQALLEALMKTPLFKEDNAEHYIAVSNALKIIAPIIVYRMLKFPKTFKIDNKNIIQWSIRFIVDLLSNGLQSVGDVYIETEQISNNVYQFRGIATSSTQTEETDVNGTSNS